MEMKPCEACGHEIQKKPKKIFSGFERRRGEKKKNRVNIYI